MGTIELDGKKEEVKDGESIISACEKLDITFGCQDGICGTCLVEVEEGMENLTEPTQEEKDMGCEGKQRLACQCKMKGGCVKFNY